MAKNSEKLIPKNNGNKNPMTNDFKNVKWAKHSDLKLRREQHVMRIKNYVEKQKLKQTLLKKLLNPNPQLYWVEEEL